MQFKHDFVGFGCVFASETGRRTGSIDGTQSAYPLHENVLVLDVGGACWGVGGETRPIIDHHFSRDGQFPSASAAVLHFADKIKTHFADVGDTIWLLSHSEPDFDALCSMYLAQSILKGEIPSTGWEDLGLSPLGWAERREDIKWKAPSVSRLPKERQWPILLASFAAHVDQCWPIHCSRQRALHSILYAAMHRGRDYTGDDGATEFFDEVVACMAGTPNSVLNPLWDSVLEDSEAFKSELALLDREVMAYERDLARSGRATVFLPVSSRKFTDWYPEAQKQPLLNENGDVASLHLDIASERYAATDGIFLRDPECIMFKDWARSDAENSPARRGFMFCGIAYSNVYPDAPVNSSRYIFSIDPERAEQRNLYSTWARLQSGEVAGLLTDNATRLREQLLESSMCRSGYEDRARFAAREGKAWYLMKDPWYDGDTYQATIVETPWGGTCIERPGDASDLSDDPIVSTLRQVLEVAVFKGGITVHDFALQPGGADTKSNTLSVYDSLSGGIEDSPDAIRFCNVTIRDGVELLTGTTARQIGETLWPLIDQGQSSGVPADFEQRHLLVNSAWVGVWNRRGFVVAAKSEASPLIDEYLNSVREIGSLRRSFTSLLAENERSSKTTSEDSVIERGESLMRDVIKLKDRLAQTDRQMLRRYFEATNIEGMLSSLSAMNTATSERILNKQSSEHLGSMVKTQHVAEIVEYVIVGVYTVEFWHLFSPGWLGGTDHGSHASLPTDVGEEASHLFSLVSHGGWNFGVLLAFLVGLFIADVINYLVIGTSPLSDLLLTKLGLKKAKH